MGRSTLIALFLLSACSRDLPPLKDRPDGGTVCIAGSHTCLLGSRCVGDFCVATCSGGARAASTTMASVGTSSVAS